MKFSPVMRGILAAARQLAAAAVGDVALLLHMDGTDGSTVFTDSSGTGKTVTNRGTSGSTISTTNPVFGTGIGRFDYNPGGLIVTPIDDFNFAAKPFTIEAQVVMTSFNADTPQPLFSYTQGQQYSPIQLRIPASNRILLDVAVPDSGLWLYNAVFDQGVNIPLNTPVHIALVGTGTQLRLFINGVEVTSSIGALTYTRLADSQLNGFYIGWGGVLAYGMRIDEFRVSKVARYTANFAPPTAAFPNPGEPEPVVASFDPNRRGTGFTLSDSNLTATATDVEQYAQLTLPKTSGKWFAEFGIASTVSNGYGAIVIMDSAGTILAKFDGYTDGSSLGQGDVIGAALDATAKTVGFYRNSSFQRTAALAGNGPFYVGVGKFRGDGSYDFRAKLTVANLYYALPEGYKAWDGTGGRPDAVPYRYYKITVTRTSSSYSGINEMEMSEQPGGANIFYPTMLTTQSDQYESRTFSYAIDGQKTNGHAGTALSAERSSWSSGPPYVGTVDTGGSFAVSELRLWAQYGSPERGPRSFTIHGSNDNSTWSLITSVVDGPSFSDGFPNVYRIATPIDVPAEPSNPAGPYRYYRLYMTSNNGGYGGDYTSLQEVELRNLVGGSDVTNPSMPAYQSDYYGPGDNRGAKAFDNEFNNFTSGSWVSDGSPAPHWISVDLGAETVIRQIALWMQAEQGHAGRSPKDFVLQGSHDNSAWENIQAFSNVTGWVVGTPKVFTINV